MAITKNKTNEKVTVKVTRVKQFDNGGIVFDINANGVDIHNMRVVEKKDGSNFFSFPSYKGKDGKYYSHVYFEITDDMIPEIEKQIESLL